MTLIPDDVLLSKLARACADEGDLIGATTFASQAALPDFVQCRRCCAPLLPGKTGQLRVKPKSLLVMSCEICSGRRAATLQLERAKKIKRKKDKTKERISTASTQTAMSVKTAVQTTKKRTAATTTPSTTSKAKTPFSFKQARLAEVTTVKSPASLERPLTLIEQAELRAKEEKRRRKSELAARPSTGSTAPTKTPAATTSKPSSSSLASIAKLLSS